MTDDGNVTVTSAQQQSSEGGENTEQQIIGENGSEDHQAPADANTKEEATPSPIKRWQKRKRKFNAGEALEKFTAFQVESKKVFLEFEEKRQAACRKQGA